jgi:transporter family-2 protein
MRLLPILGLALLGVGAGVSVVVQQVLVASLRISLGSAPWPALISYVGGTLTMILIIVLMREPCISTAGVTKSSWPSLAAGVFGVIYIVLAIVLIPKLGAATVVALIVAGQLLASLTFDHFGMFGVPQQPADL